MLVSMHKSYVTRPGHCIANSSGNHECNADNLLLEEAKSIQKFEKVFSEKHCRVRGESWRREYVNSVEPLLEHSINSAVAGTKSPKQSRKRVKLVEK